MGNINTKEKYIISYTTNFKKQYKKIIKLHKEYLTDLGAMKVLKNCYRTFPVQKNFVKCVN